MNPIISREVRSRWRGLKAFGSVLAFASILALIVFWAYSDAVTGSRSLGHAKRNPGENLFAILTCMQIAGWILFAPTLTATTIASEREQGLLEALQLSPLTPFQIVGGKFASALLFLLLMMTASLPAQAVCIMLGGVSPTEFVLANLLSCTTALTCAGIGLTCSAWTRRGSIAFRSTFILVVVWSIGSAILWYSSHPGPYFRDMLWFWLARLTGLTNPVVAAISIVSPQASLNSIPAAASISSSPLLAYFFSVPVWVYCMLSQGLALGVMLWSSTRALRRPLPEQYWIEPKKEAISAPPIPGSARAASRPRKPQKLATSWWEIPILSQLRFANPVLMREARGKFRMRQVPLWVIVFEAALAFGVLIFYCYVIYWAIFEPATRDVIWWGLTAIGFLILVIAAPMMGAAAFTREREAGTWEGLRISLLSAREIIFGKVAAILLTCALLSIPVWPALLLCIRGVTSARHGVSVVQALLVLILVFATVWCYTMISMTYSWLARKTPVAAGWTIATLFAINVILPFIASFGRFDENLLVRFTPGLSLIMIGTIHDTLPASTEGALTLLICLSSHSAVAYVLFRMLQRRVQGSQ